MKIKDTGGGDFELAPQGAHIVRCHRVLDMGTHESEWQGKKRNRRLILLTWELTGVPMSDGRPFTVNKRYTASLSEKSDLRADLKSWRGRDFTPEELEGFDPMILCGKPCMINIVHEAKNGKTYTNVTSIMPLPAGVTAPPLVNPQIKLSLEPDEFDRSVFDQLGDGMKKKIAESAEYKELTTGVPASSGGGESGPPEDWQ